MLSTIQSFAVVVTSVALVIAVLILRYRARGPRPSGPPGDVAGWHISLIGVTYAVTLAFMLSGVWANYQEADANAVAEATALMNLFRIADGLPAPQRRQLQALSRDYATTAVTSEWPAMARDSSSPAGFRVTEQLWTTLLQTDARSPSEQASFGQAIEALRGMTEHRHVRLLQSRSQLPRILWAVLIVGGLMTVGAACTYDVRSLRLHAFQASTLALLVALTLVAIAEVDRPFQGEVRVSPDGFELARATFGRLAPAAR